MHNENQRKGDENMEAMNKPREAMVVTQGMTKAFVDLLASQKRSEDYWSQCKNSNPKLSTATMDKLKKKCNEEK